MTGERVQVKGIVDLWNDLWGIKPKPADVPENIDESANWDEVEEEPNKESAWERKFKK